MLVLLKGVFLIRRLSMAKVIFEHPDGNTKQINIRNGQMVIPLLNLAFRHLNLPLFSNIFIVVFRTRLSNGVVHFRSRIIYYEFNFNLLSQTLKKPHSPREMQSTIYHIYYIYNVLHFPTLVLSRSGAKGQDTLSQPDMPAPLVLDLLCSFHL